MNCLKTSGLALLVLFLPIMTHAAPISCKALDEDIYQVIPSQWVLPGEYRGWNTDCVHYVFNRITRPSDASYYVPETGRFLNYGFATNTITDLAGDSHNATVAAQINAWSSVRSGAHKLFGAAIQTADTADGDAQTTIVATESQVNSRNSENTAPKVGLDTVLFTAHGSEGEDIGSDNYNLNSWAHFISAAPPKKGEHAGWERGIHVSRWGLGTSVKRNFKTMIDLEQVRDSVCLVTFTRRNGKVGCLRYNIEKDQMEIVGDIYKNTDVKTFQTF